MDEVTRQALDYYQCKRFNDQIEYYRDRSSEYQGAQLQASAWSGVFLVLSALGAALGTADIAGLRRTWAIAAAVFAALSAAVVSYAATYQYDTLAQTYQGAVDALGLLAPDRPGADGSGSDVDRYVGQAESILLAEVERWGKSAESVDTLTGSRTAGTSAGSSDANAPGPPSASAGTPPGGAAGPAGAAPGQGQNHNTE
jgi:hypothetical protein